MNVGNYIFEQTVKNAKTDAVKFLTAFPTILRGIMLDQHPNLITTADVPKKRESSLTLHHKLFGVDYVPNIVGTSGVVPATRMMTKQEIVAALNDTCVMLDERKAQFELMIHSLESEDVAAEDELEYNDEDDVEEAGNEDEGSEEGSGSSSEAE